jgi:RNA polymerase sigma factor (sigma-70 family)
MSNPPDQRFASLVHPHLAALYRAALRLTRRRHDAEDLTQEVCLRACDRLEELARTTSPRAWLMRALYNLFIDSTRRSRLRARFMLFNGASDQGAATFDDVSSPDRVADVRLMHERIAMVWGRLESEQRALLSLHAEGHGLDELAVIFAVNRNAVSARLHRARSRLARLLDASEDKSTLKLVENKP